MEVILNREVIINKAVCKTIGVAGFIILTALSGFVRIPLPFTPVPMTLQTLFVLLSGAFLGARLGGVTQLGYIILGIIGFPLFSQASSGLLYLGGPTGGYLIGFILAAFLLGSFIRQFEGSFLLSISLFLLADMVILGCGTLWLKLIYGLSLSEALVLGFLPFLPGDLLKVFLAQATYSRLKNRIKSVF